MSMFGNEGTLLNMYLPGSVFYLHPCIDHYTEYENRKRFAVNTDEKSTVKMLQKVMTKVSGNPGGAVFKDGSKFPNTVIVSPMVLIHHFAFNYEALIKKVTAVLEESDTVAVDMTSDC